MPQAVLVGAGLLALLPLLMPVPLPPSVSSLVETLRAPATTAVEAFPAPGPVTATLTADLQRQSRLLATQA